MDDADQVEYLKGQIEMKNPICDALFDVLCRNLSTADIIDVRIGIRSSVNRLVTEIDDHPGFTGKPFNDGARDALAEFSRELLN